MTQDHSSKLSFSIEESVWLNKGQEISEILSLSLDPEITVQENGEYVTIRGGLKLSGEYRSAAVSEDENGSSSLVDQVRFRSIEEVTINEDGTGEIKHKFPIDVTIPKERIRSLDDIYVIVESFDYDLPDRGCIQLTADVAITGMSKDSDEIAHRDNIDEEATEMEQRVEKEDRDFQFEAYAEATSTEENDYEDNVVSFPSDEEVTSFVSEETEEERDTVVEEETVEFIAENDEVGGVECNDNERAEVEEIEEVELVEPIEEVKVKNIVPSVAFGIIKDCPKVEAVHKVQENNDQKEETFSKLKNLADNRSEQMENVQVENVAATDKAEVTVTEIEIPVSETPKQEEKTAKEENALYLTKMLTKGEEQFKKLKICIIQENESLDTIAKRYSISQSAIIKVNELDDALVEEGQILYIPMS